MSAKPLYAQPADYEKQFIYTLRKNVAQYFKDTKQPTHAGNKLIPRAVFLLLLFVLIRLVLIFNSQTLWLFYLCNILTGIIALPIILNIGHDAVHNNFSGNKFINKLGSGVFYLFGTSTYFWKLRHIHAHHAYTNVPDWDQDIAQSKIIRLHTKQKHLWFHQLQYVYMPFLFSIYTLNWFFYRDLKDIFSHRFGNKIIQRHPAVQIFLLLVSKFSFLFLMMIVPVLWLDVPISAALIGFLLFNISAGLTVTLALVSTHVGSQQAFVQPINNQLPYSWEIHQLKTTADFATKNKFITRFFGGFNHHVAHHIFPGISHVHFNAITPIIQRTTQEFDITYFESPTLISAIREHFTLLKIRGLKDEF